MRLFHYRRRSFYLLKEIYLSNKHLANTYYVANIVLNTRDTSLKSHDLHPQVVEGLRGKTN